MNTVMATSTQGDEVVRRIIPTVRSKNQVVGRQVRAALAHTTLKAVSLVNPDAKLVVLLCGKLQPTSLCGQIQIAISTRQSA
jgi:hypothetical protein